MKAMTLRYWTALRTELGYDPGDEYEMSVASAVCGADNLRDNTHKKKARSRWRQRLRNWLPSQNNNSNNNNRHFVFWHARSHASDAPTVSESTGATTGGSTFGGDSNTSANIVIDRTAGGTATTAIALTLPTGIDDVHRQHLRVHLRRHLRRHGSHTRYLVWQWTRNSHYGIRTDTMEEISRSRTLTSVRLCGSGHLTARSYADHRSELMHEKLYSVPPPLDADVGSNAKKPLNADRTQSVSAECEQPESLQECLFWYYQVCKQMDGGEGLSGATS